MSKRDFLSKLDEYLSYELPERMVRKNIDYYSGYIDDEVRKGRSVNEVLEDLGDPQLIAHSIIDAATCGEDGIPNTADDRDFTGEMYGNSQSASEVDGQDTSYRSGYSGSGESTSGGSSYTDPDGSSRSGFGGNNIHVYSGGCFTAVLVALVVFALFSVIGTILGLLSPVLAPVCVVLLILWLFGRKDR